MLELLQSIALSKGLAFSFGDLSDLNNFADSVKDEDPKVLFYSCYQRITLNELDGAPALTRSKPVEVYILSPSDLTDQPDQRLSTIDECIELAVAVFKQLNATYGLNTATVDPIITQTDRSLDGVLLTASYKTDPESIC